MALALWVVSAGAAHAASCPEQALEAAKAFYKQARFAEAAQATRGVESCVDGTAEELAEALRWRAQAAAVKGDEESALDAFELLATVDPSYRLERSVSPKIRRLAQKAQQDAARSHRVFARILEPRQDARTVTLRAQAFSAAKERLDVSFEADGLEHHPIAAARVGDVDFEAPAPERGGAFRVHAKAPSGSTFRSGPTISVPARPKLEPPSAAGTEPTPPPTPPVAVAEPPPLVTPASPPASVPEEVLHPAAPPPPGPSAEAHSGRGWLLPTAVVVAVAAVGGGVAVLLIKPAPLGGSLGRIDLP